jgi:curved DNA-binding protein CbpA
LKKKVNDLYAILRTHREATQQEIKRAFRKRSKETHPDIYGDSVVEEFHRVKMAYEILGDKEKRKFYDKTGCIQAEEKEINAVAAQILTQAFQKTISQLKGNIFFVDLPGKVKEQLLVEQEDMKENMRKAQLSIRNINKIIGKIIKKTDKFPEILRSFLLQERQKLVSMIRQVIDSLEYNKRAIEMIEEYDFNKDPIPFREVSAETSCTNSKSHLVFRF